MMDYNASITYTQPGHRPTPSAPRQANDEGRFLGLQCPVCGRIYTGGKGYCPVDAVELGPRARGRPPAARHDHQLHDHHAGAVPGPDRDRAVRPRARAGSTAPTSCSATSRCSTRPNDDVRVGMRVAAVWASRRRDGDDLRVRRAEGNLLGWMPTGEPDVDDPDLVNRIQLMPHTPTTSRSSAGRISPMVRNTDKTEAQMLLEVITGAVDRRRHHPQRRRLHLRRQLRLRRRPGVLVRAEHRRHRRVAAEARLARRDGRRVGAVRGVAPAAARRHRRRAWRWARAGRRPPTPRSIYPMEMDPYYLAPLGADAADVRGAAGPGADRRGQGRPSGRWPRSRPGAGATRRATRTRRSPATSTSTRCSPSDYVRAPLRRHDLPPITDGAVRGRDRPRRQGPRAVRAPGVHHRLRHCTELPLPGHAATSTTRRRPRSRPRPRASDEAPVEVAELQAAFTHEEPLLVEALGLGADVAVNPSGGPLAANPIMATGLVPHRRSRRRTSATAASTRTLAHSTSGPCLQQNLVCILEGDDQVSHQPCAIVGIGQTHHKKRASRRVARRPRPRGRAAARSTTRT